MSDSSIHGRECIYTSGVHKSYTYTYGRKNDIVLSRPNLIGFHSTSLEGMGLGVDLFMEEPDVLSCCFSGKGETDLTTIGGARVDAGGSAWIDLHNMYLKNMKI